MKILKKITDNPDLARENLKKRGMKTEIINDILKIAKERSHLIQKYENLKNKKNKLTSLISEERTKDPQKREMLKKMKEEISEMLKLVNDINSEIENKLLEVPNQVHESVPEGVGEEDNVVLETFNEELIEKNFKGIPHFEVAEKLNMFSPKMGARISGSRFLVYQEKLAKLIRALINFFLDFNSSRGYKEMNVPHLVNEKMLKGTGQLPKFRDDLFKVEGEDLWLIPTAEVPLTTLDHYQIISLEKPICYTAFTKCFRSEAGSGGRDIRGMIRLREFHKVEIVKIVKPEQAYEEYEKTIDDITTLLSQLRIPFRKVLLCSGDLGFSAEKTIDFEVWMPSEGKFREISSVSIFSDFQTIRSKIRYRERERNSLREPYTINGSALAVDRCVAAILENCQDVEEGTIIIPDCLKPYYKRKIL